MSKSNKNGVIISDDVAKKMVDEINNKDIPLMFNGHKAGYCLNAVESEDGMSYSCTVKIDSEELQKMVQDGHVGFSGYGKIKKDSETPHSVISDFDLIQFSIVSEDPYKQGKDDE